MKSERNERQMKRHREINEGREKERERDGEATWAAGPVHFPGQVGNTLS
jgi:hypothetical protein